MDRKIGIKQELWNKADFWAIWGSCIDKKRSLFAIQDFWGFRGNKLYSKDTTSLVTGMIGKYLKVSSKAGPYSDRYKHKLYSARMEWIPIYLGTFGKKSHDYLAGQRGVKNSFRKFTDGYSGSNIEFWENLIKTNDINIISKTFFDLDLLKILFKNRSTPGDIKSNFHLLLTGSMITTYLLRKKLKKTYPTESQLSEIFLNMAFMAFRGVFNVDEYLIELEKKHGELLDKLKYPTEDDLRSTAAPFPHLEKLAEPHLKGLSREQKNVVKNCLKK